MPGKKAQLNNICLVLNKTMVRTDAITLKQLRALTAIDSAGNVTAAAELLNVTPPAVSTQLKLLEMNVGAKLMERSPNGRVSLTPEGREMLSAVSRIEQTLSSATAKIASLRSGKTGHVDFGVVSTGKYFAPGLIKRAMEAMPGVEFRLHVGNRDQIRTALADESIDVAIMGRPPREPLVESVPIADHPYLLVASPQHRLARADSVRMKDLDGEMFLVREQGSGSRILNDRFIEKLNEKINVGSMELGSNETIKQGVIAGLGISILSGHTVAAELDIGRLEAISLQGLPIVKQWFLVMPKSKSPDAAALRFQTFLLSLNEDYLPDLSRYCRPSNA